METKNLKKTHTREKKRFTNITIQHKIQNNPLRGYSTAALIHSKFSNLVSSGTVYSIRYSPKKKRAA